MKNHRLKNQSMKNRRIKNISREKFGVKFRFSKRGWRLSASAFTFAFTVAINGYANSLRVETLSSETTHDSRITGSFGQEKKSDQIRWMGSLSIGSIRTDATDSSPETKTVDLNESIDAITPTNWTLAADGKQSHENEGLNVSEYGISAQKKIYYTKLKPKKANEDDSDPFRPNFSVKVRLAGGQTTQGSATRLTRRGTALPKLLGFHERNQTLALGWSFHEDWQVSISYTKYQYPDFDRAQAYLYSHPGIATRLTGISSSVSSVVDHETAASVDWYFSNNFDVNLSETLQTDYVTGSSGSTSQVELTWACAKKWDVSIIANTQKSTEQPATPVVNPNGTPASTSQYLGASVTYDFD